MDRCLKKDLADKMWNHLNKAADIAKEIDDDKLCAMISTINVMIYNGQLDLMDEMFVHFRDNIFPKVRQPESRKGDTNESTFNA